MSVFDITENHEEPDPIDHYFNQRARSNHTNAEVHSSAESNFEYCPYCGSKVIEETYKYCPKCGKEIRS
ncbi:Double zinc ribbon [compost metagenome]